MNENGKCELHQLSTNSWTFAAPDLHSRGKRHDPYIQIKTFDIHFQKNTPPMPLVTKRVVFEGLAQELWTPTQTQPACLRSS